MNERWEQAWREGRIPFHVGTVNETLTTYAHRLFDGAHRVLVPLCGKSVDLAWLVEQGHDVIGVELSDVAVRALFEESGLEHEVVPGEPTLYRSPRLSVFQGDLFHVAPERVRGTWESIAPVRVWDRAAMVALPEELRGIYVDQIRRLAGPGARVLLDVVVYDQARMSGPPWSVDEDEVRSRYAGARVERLALDDQPVAPRWKEAGLDRMQRAVYLVDL